MKKLLIRPTSSVLTTYRRLSYKPWSAIAEFVDNSTASYFKYKEQLIEHYGEYYVCNVSVNYDLKDNKLVIADNAYGMEFNDFERAIRIDSPPKDTSGRNEFGMGLKTAASWFGDKWKVETSQLGSNKKYSAYIDLDDIKTNKPDEIEYHEDYAHASEHYTVITIWNLAHQIKGRTVGRIKKELSSIYRRDINNGEINIEWRGEKLSYDKPVLRKNSDENIYKRIQFVVENDISGELLEVKGWAGVLETGNRNAAGLTIFRRGRVIVGGEGKNYRPHEIFGDSGSFRYQRVIGELDLDDWPVSQAKDAIDWNGELEDSFINKLKDQLSDIISFAENARYKKTKKTPLEFDSKTKKEIKEDMGNQIVKSNYLELSETEYFKDQFSAGHEKTLEQEEYVENVNEKHSKTDVEEILSETLNGIHYIVYWRDNNEKEWLSVQNITEIERKIILNVTHPFFIPFNENPQFMKTITLFVISLVHSIDLVKNANLPVDYIRQRMNGILKKFSQGD